MELYRSPASLRHHSCGTSIGHIVLWQELVSWRLLISLPRDHYSHCSRRVCARAGLLTPVRTIRLNLTLEGKTVVSLKMQDGYSDANSGDHDAAEGLRLGLVFVDLVHIRTECQVSSVPGTFLRPTVHRLG